MCLISLLSGTLVVSYIKTVSLPTYLVLLCVLYRINERFHAVVVIAVWFHEVDDVEAIDFVFSSILHSEIVPLSKAISTIVILEVEVILCIRNLDCLPQISRLEPRLENQCAVTWILDFVVRFQIFIISI